LLFQGAFTRTDTPLVAAILATEASLREDEGAYDQSERVAASPRTAARVAASVGTS